MKVELEDCDLAVIVEQVLARVLARREADAKRFGGRLAFTEPEAAAMLGMKPYFCETPDFAARSSAPGSAKKFFTAARSC